jgi:uncharacterized protein YnzC (UPF0291/DUF896 family)
VLSQEKLDRINVLAQKKKTTGLSEAEAVEQKELREAYLKAFRSNFRKQLDNIDIVYKD